MGASTGGETMAFEAQAQQQYDEQKKLRHDSIKAYQLMGAVIVLALGIYIGSQWFGGDPDADGYTVNLFTELISIGMTVLVLNWFAERRGRNERKQALMRQLGSQSNEFALEAKRLLEMEEGWLEEALAQKQFERANWQGMVLPEADLSGADLQHANLSEARLEYANLNNARLYNTQLINATLWEANLMNVNIMNSVMYKAALWRTNLSGANLTLCNLSETNMSGAILVDTKLGSADLANANLVEANLAKSFLGHANLSKANLEDANLEGSWLNNAHFDEDTILPDGQRWTPRVKMAHFTDANYPGGIWRSENANSPAYRGKA